MSIKYVAHAAHGTGLVLLRVEVKEILSEMKEAARYDIFDKDINHIRNDEALRSRYNTKPHNVVKLQTRRC